MYVLEIEAEGMPRMVGPFGTKKAALDWGGLHIRTGSYNAAPVDHPADVARQP